MECWHGRQSCTAPPLVQCPSSDEEEFWSCNASRCRWKTRLGLFVNNAESRCMHEGQLLVQQRGLHRHKSPCSRAMMRGRGWLQDMYKGNDSFGRVPGTSWKLYGRFDVWYSPLSVIDMDSYTHQDIAPGGVHENYQQMGISWRRGPLGCMTHNQQPRDVTPITVCKRCDADTVCKGCDADTVCKRCDADTVCMRCDADTVCMRLHFCRNDGGERCTAEAGFVAIKNGAGSLHWQVQYFHRHIAANLSVLVSQIWPCFDCFPTGCGCDQVFT